MSSLMGVPHSPEELAHIHPELLPPNNISAIFFDLDGTLVDTLGLYCRSWIDIFAPYGFLPTPEWFATVASLPLLEYVEAAVPGLPDETKRLLGDAASANFQANLHTLEPMERIVEVVHAFHGRLPLAVVSSGPRDNVHGALEAVQLQRYFDLVLGLEDVGVPKPDPSCYHRALAHFGLQSHEVIVYEDSPAGMRAADLAGLTWIDVRPHTTGIKAHG